MRRAQLLLTLIAAAPAFGIACAADAYTFKVLHSFCTEANCADGNTPYGGVTADSAGRLYGTAGWGGKTGGGVAFELSRDANGAWKYEAIHNFCGKDGCTDGALPVGTLVVGASGALYGTTNVGGKLGYGAVFRLSPNADRSRWSLTLLHNFCDPTQCSGDGAQPFSGPTYTQAAERLPYDEISPLYGLTYAGGLNHGGTAYELKPPSGRKKWREKVVYDFCSQGSCADGAFPFGSLTPDAFGHFFGTATGGDAGIAFELASSRKQKESILYSFCSLANCADGSGPGDLTLDANGSLLGTTVAGGSCSADSNGCGVIFKLTPGKPWQESVLYNFCSQPDCRDGRSGGDILLDTAGTLFGTTSAGGGHDIDKDAKGGGTVFAFNGTSLQVLYAFCAEANCADGEQPLPHLAMDSAGNLYGTTFYGGAHGAGEVFEVSP